MSGVQMWDSNSSDKEQEEFECLDCGCTTSEADFESVDDELNPQRPRCPDCQSSLRISRATCDCGEPRLMRLSQGSFATIAMTTMSAGTCGTNA